MAPTESQILSQTLLPPSSLQTILPLKQFTSLFPPSQRTSPQIPVLYRALQLQRGLDLDAIRENIAAEVRRGREQIRELARMRARDARGNGVEIQNSLMEDEDYGQGGLDGGVVLPGRRVGVHSGKTLCEGMEDAEADLKDEVERLEDEVRRLVGKCEAIVEAVGGLEMSGVDLDAKGIVGDLDRLREKAEGRLGM